MIMEKENKMFDVLYVWNWCGLQSNQYQKVQV